MKHLDQSLTALAATPTDRDLADLDRDVWRMIDARPAILMKRIQPIQWAAVSAALVVGVVTGTVAMTSFDQPTEMSVFSSHSPMAPSTLLADHA